MALDQPRCVPCTLDAAGLDLAASHALRTCKCTVHALATAFKDLVPGSEQPWRDFPAKPPVSCVCACCACPGLHCCPRRSLAARLAA